MDPSYTLMTTDQLKSENLFFEVTSRLPYELKCLVMAHCLVSLDPESHCWCLMLDFIKACPCSEFKFEICSDYLKLESLYTKTITFSPCAFNKYSYILNSKIKIEKVVITHQSSNNPMWNTLLDLSPEVVLDGITNWSTLKFDRFDKITSISHLGLNAYHQLLNPLRLSKFKKLQKLSIRLDGQELKFFKPCKLVFSKLKSVTLIYDGNSDILLCPKITSLLKLSNFHLKLLWITVPVNPGVIDIISCHSLEAIKLNSEADVFKYGNAFARLSSLMIRCKSLKGFTFECRTLHMIVINCEDVSNCDFSRLCKLRHISLTANMDMASVNSIPPSVHKMTLNFKNHRPCGKSKFTLPMNLRTLFFYSWDAFELLDFSNCVQLNKIELSGRLSDLDSDLSLQVLNEHHPIWDTIPVTLSSFAITFDSDDYGYFTEKFLGVKVKTNLLTKLEFCFNFGFKCLICANFANDGDTSWCNSIQQKLKLPLVVIDNSSSDAIFNMKYSNNVLVHRSMYDELISIDDCVSDKSTVSHELGFTFHNYQYS
ncbi:unnamed protein product [Ambrosiozyma monospora]|uniref:Unnamed protein product n=1 Tax=Ambrosiozyma monospora TaxID=43982 RepID=A0ACB5T5T3_AMBMO|nr:unnamed protein product [Ambrosiozyma monospora]